MSSQPKNPSDLAKMIETRSPSKNRMNPPFDPATARQYNMRIDRNGTWHYQGTPINRIALSRLFSTVLKKDQDGVYWLATPVEHGQIEVEDVPFTAVSVESEDSGTRQTLHFRTNFDEIVTAGPDHPIRITENRDTGEPTPYIIVRDNLEARLLRPVYYELAELAVENERCPGQLGVWSGGMFFVLGLAE